MTKRQSGNPRISKIQDILDALHVRAPREAAADWDNVGLLVGDPGTRTEAAVVSVDLTEDALALAKKSGAKLIVNHHPCIFTAGGGLSNITPGRPGTLQARVFEALKSGISVVACHTNFDTCAMEVIQAVVDGLGVAPVGRLHDDASLLKLAVFVPRTHIEAVRNAVCQAGAGQIGQYDSCTFSSPGTGTFRGLEGTNPFLGKPGKLERAEEERLEVLLPAGLKGQVLSALRASHPYEEIAFDLYEVHQSVPKKGLTRGLGYGFWGELSKPQSLDAVRAAVLKLFKSDGCLVTPAAGQKAIKRIGFVAGKGASFVSAAASAGCDLFVTGEAGYHTALRGAGLGMTVMEIGHVQSELFFNVVMAQWLKEMGLSVHSAARPSQSFVLNG